MTKYTASRLNSMLKLDVFNFCLFIVIIVFILFIVTIYDNLIVGNVCGKGIKLKL